MAQQRPIAERQYGRKALAMAREPTVPNCIDTSMDSMEPA
jgi:hypothetical protein